MNDELLDIFTHWIRHLAKEKAKVDPDETIDGYSAWMELQGGIWALESVLSEYHRRMEETGMSHKFSSLCGRLGGLVAEARWELNS